MLPLLGISACDETSQSYIQAWCLSALTDRAVADATAFLSSATSRGKPVDLGGSH